MSSFNPRQHNKIAQGLHDVIDVGNCAAIAPKEVYVTCAHVGGICHNIMPHVFE